jgi:hypothetical protein
VNGSVKTGSHIITRIGLVFRGHSLSAAVPDTLGQIMQVDDVRASITMPADAGGLRRRCGSTGRRLRFATATFCSTTSRRTCSRARVLAISAGG